jgi:hypothetical protein
MRNLVSHPKGITQLEDRMLRRIFGLKKEVTGS